MTSKVGSTAPRAPNLWPCQNALVADSDPRSLSLAPVKAGMIWIVTFAIAFVWQEPAPYELLMVVLVAVAFLGGLGIPRSIAPLLACLVIYMLGGMLAVTQVPELDKAPLYMAVSGFLAASSIFYAAIIAANPSRMSLIANALIAAGILTSFIGTLAYFGVLPGSELFLRFDRARGTFEDPNVFGAFLIIPIAFLLRRLLTGSLNELPVTSILLAILTVGVLLSFSRAAWGLLIGVGGLTVLITLIDSPSPRVKLRAMILAALGTAALVLLILAILASGDVADVFRQRASFSQSYDVGAYGRFERHWLGFILATELPLGLGPSEFWKIYGEDPHNVYLKGFIAYGWLGGISYILLIALTFFRFCPILFRRRPWTELAQAVFVVFSLYTLLGWIIDTDHWRHMYMLIGLAWGVIAAEDRWGATYEERNQRYRQRTIGQLVAAVK